MNLTPNPRNVFTFLTGKSSQMIDYKYTPRFYETVQWMCRDIGNATGDYVMTDVFWDYYGPKPMGVDQILEKHNIRRHQIYNKLNKIKELLKTDPAFKDIKAELHANMENKTVRLSESQLLEREISELELKLGILEDQAQDLILKKAKLEGRLSEVYNSTIVD